jgi:hypothetical protein
LQKNLDEEDHRLDVEIGLHNDSLRSHIDVDRAMDDSEDDAEMFQFSISRASTTRISDTISSSNVRITRLSLLGYLRR